VQGIGTREHPETIFLIAEVPARFLESEVRIQLEVFQLAARKSRQILETARLFKRARADASALARALGPDINISTRDFRRLINDGIKMAGWNKECHRSRIQGYFLPGRPSGASKRALPARVHSYSGVVGNLAIIRCLGDSRNNGNGLRHHRRTKTATT